MKKIIVFSILSFILILALFSSNHTFIFKDGVLNYINSSDRVFEIPEGFDVQWVIGADNWSLKEQTEQFSFRIVSLEDYGNYDLIELKNGIFLIEELNSILFYNRQLSKYCITSKDNLNKITPSRVLEVTSRRDYYVGLISRGNWEIIYEMLENGTFIQKLQIQSPEIGKSNVYVINKNIRDSSTEIDMTKSYVTRSFGAGEFESEIVSDTFVLKLGEVLLDGKVMNFTLDSFRILAFEDRYTISTNFFIDSIKNRNAEIIRVFDNTTYNNAGANLPAGRVLIYENFDNRDFVVKTGNIGNTAINETAKIHLGTSWAVKYDITKISDRTVRDQNTRIIQYDIDIRNFSDENKKLTFSMVTSGIELQNYNFDNSFYNIKNNSSQGNISFDFELQKNSAGTISLTVLYKY